MKKTIIILSVLLISCTANVGDLRQRTLIVTDASILSSKQNSAIYSARSYNGDTYTDTIDFIDDIGKYRVGDTIKIVKR
jgi:hypothetical protein